jgi:hypothetical protein
MSDVDTMVEEVVESLILDGTATVTSMPPGRLTGTCQKTDDGTGHLPGVMTPSSHLRKMGRIPLGDETPFTLAGMGCRAL